MKTSLLIRKKKSNVLPRRKFRGIDDIDEPEWEGVIDNASDFRLSKALNFYNYVDLKDGPKTRREWVLEYARSRKFASDEIGSLEKIEDWRISSISSMSRLSLRGEISPELLAVHDERIKEQIRKSTKGKPEAKEEEAKVEGPKFNRFAERLSDLIADIEELIDKAEGFSAYDILTQKEASTPQAKAIADFYRPRLEELSAIKNDPQLKEGYSHFSRHEINKLKELFSSIVEGAERFAGNKKAAKAPRKRKEKSSVQIVKGVNYLKDFSELQLRSVDPSGIVGSREVWLYNVKYKTLRRLIGKSLTISGSTVKDFDETTSIQKSLRKPKQILPRVLDAGHKVVGKIMDELATKASVANGRINGDTIILRVLK